MPTASQWYQEPDDSDKPSPLEERTEGSCHDDIVTDPPIVAEDSTHASAPSPADTEASNDNPTVTEACVSDYQSSLHGYEEYPNPSRVESSQPDLIQLNHMLQSIHGLREMLEKEGAILIEPDSMNADLTQYGT